MSSSMRNFLEAYTAVHSKEAKEELNSQRDPISEMNTARLQDNDLRDLAEVVLEEVFKTSTVKEAEDIIFNMIPESNIVGREEKLERIYAAFGETFSKIRLKNQAGQMEEFAKYRQKKRLEETWSARFNQDKRVARVHSTVIAEDVAVIKKGLLGLFEKKKGDPCWVGYKQVGMKNKGGKQVPNCVPASEAAQYDEMYKGKHGQSDKQYQDSRSDAGKMVSGDSKMSGAAYSSRSMKGTGPNPAGGSKKPAGQGRMTSGARTDLQFRKAALKKEEFATEGIRDMDPEKGTKERKAKLEKKRGMKMDDHPQYKEEFVVEKGMNPGFKAYLDKQKKKKGGGEGGDAPKGGGKPDFIDLDKDGDKKESMKKAAHDKKKGMKEELESSGKFSESEILKILASL